MDYETRKILITVKAYPNPSKKYVETVCVVGMDLEKWMVKAYLSLKLL
jgi:hypothetical protein